MENNLESLTIGVFAKAAGVNVETIRFYQLKGLLPQPERPYGSIRRYGQANVARVKFVKSAQRLGFSGAWIGNLTVLEPYRPIFIGAALVALFFAWRRIFRPAAACKPGEVCAIPQVRTTYQLIFWIVAVLVLLALGFPYVMPFFY